ncbi:MAG TPA: hypothetical protein VGD08_22090 [Stellaceae bacterium]
MKVAAVVKAGLAQQSADGAGMRMLPESRFFGFLRRLVTRCTNEKCHAVRRILYPGAPMRHEICTLFTGNAAN